MSFNFTTSGLFFDVSDDSAFEALMADLESDGTPGPLSTLLCTTTELAKELNGETERAARAKAAKVEADAKAAREAAEAAATRAKRVAMGKEGFAWNNLTIRWECMKCNGRGVLQHYRHVSNGICFNCDGAGYRVD
jgi:hypothetical protein